MKPIREWPEYKAAVIAIDNLDERVHAEFNGSDRKARLERRDVKRLVEDVTDYANEYNFEQERD